MPAKEPRRCSVKGCDNTHLSKGYCSHHYNVIVRKASARPPCRVCGKRSQARRLCAACYSRRHRRGTVKHKWSSIEERFWSKVAKLDEDGNPWPKGCWEWIGTQETRMGAGLFHVSGTDEAGDRLIVPAARFMWLITYGSIPDGMWVVHDCRWWSCVNPEHLALMTPAEAIHRSQQEGWRPAGSLG